MYAIIVAGMHRSATSALTGCLSLLGAELGSTLLAPAEDNKRGFWENSSLVAIHDRLLERLGSSWSDPLPLPSEWWKAEAVSEFKRELKGILSEQFGSHPLWAFKDPRTCRLLPLWKELLSDCGRKPVFLIPVRNPLEVAASLHSRNGFPMWKGQLLWLRHVLAAEKETRGYPRMFVTYEQLLADWKSVFLRIEEQLGISWPKSVEEASSEIEAFLSPSLKHQKRERPGVGGGAHVDGWCARVYELTVGAAENGESPGVLQGLDQVVREMEQPSPLVDQILVTNMDQERRAAEYEERVKTLSDALQQARAELDAIRLSRAWRATYPVRRAIDLAKQLARRS